ncbi:MAG: hypothetical protein IKE42_02770 [Aquamicrobium sp.]|nr:hypothetical protein [Aquamicrobium sp.]PLP61042.1 hypothetical protein CYK37_01740 [Mesorhizobium loti]QAZ46549.1 hypothetical protein C1M53_30120 [Mesorhizobium sp. Pch-S]
MLWPCLGQQSVGGGQVESFPLSMSRLMILFLMLGSFAVMFSIVVRASDQMNQPVVSSKCTGVLMPCLSKR